MIFCITIPTFASTAEVEETVVADPGLGSGTAVITFKEREGWPGYNVVIEVYNQTVGDFYTVYCYRQNGYVARETLPAGAYTVDVVMAAGDNLGDFPLSTSVNSFSLGNGKAASLDIYYSGESLIEESEVATPSVIEDGGNDIQVETSEDLNNQNTVGDTLKNSVLDIIKANLIFTLPFGILGAIYYFKIYKPKKDLNNDDQV